eukprot:3404531-Pleurochrysis_carterae.AAC.3
MNEELPSCARPQRPQMRCRMGSRQSAARWPEHEAEFGAGLQQRGERVGSPRHPLAATVAQTQEEHQVMEAQIPRHQSRTEHAGSMSVHAQLQMVQRLSPKESSCLRIQQCLEVVQRQELRRVAEPHVRFLIVIDDADATVPSIPGRAAGGVGRPREGTLVAAAGAVPAIRGKRYGRGLLGSAVTVAEGVVRVNRRPTGGAAVAGGSRLSSGRRGRCWCWHLILCSRRVLRIHVSKRKASCLDGIPNAFQFGQEELRLGRLLCSRCEHHTSVESIGRKIVMETTATPLGLCCCDHSRSGSIERFEVIRESLKSHIPRPLDVKCEVRPCVRSRHSQGECPPCCQAYCSWQCHTKVTQLLTRPSGDGFWLRARRHEYILHHAARLTGVPVHHDFLDYTRHPLVVPQQALREVTDAGALIPDAALEYVCGGSRSSLPSTESDLPDASLAAAVANPRRCEVG